LRNFAFSPCHPDFSAYLHYAFRDLGTLMIFKTRSSAILALGLILAIALDTGVQLLLKMVASGISGEASQWEMLATTLSQPIFFVTAILMILQLINWLEVLKLSDLSYAQPISSLSYVSVYILSAIYFGEKIDALQIVGITIIVAGVWCISRTGSWQSEAVSR
jgi:drug/metabolite transporter (DMT)-like permease